MRRGQKLESKSMKSVILHSSKSILPILSAASLTGATVFAANAESTASDRGTIEKVDPQAKTLTLKSKHGKAEEVFVWNDSTKFLEKDQRLSKSHPATAADLKQGEEIRISYHKENHQMVAKSVVISPAHHSSGTGNKS